MKNFSIEQIADNKKRIKLEGYITYVQLHEPNNFAKDKDEPMHYSFNFFSGDDELKDKIEELQVSLCGDVGASYRWAKDSRDLPSVKKLEEWCGETGLFRWSMKNSNPIQVFDENKKNLTPKEISKLVKSGSKVKIVADIEYWGRDDKKGAKVTPLVVQYIGEGYSGSANKENTTVGLSASEAESLL